MGLLRLEEVATRLNLSYTQVRLMVLDGKIPSVKVGARGIRVEEGALEEYIGQLKAKAVPARRA